MIKVCVLLAVTIRRNKGNEWLVCCPYIDVYVYVSREEKLGGGLAGHVYVGALLFERGTRVQEITGWQRKNYDQFISDDFRIKCFAFCL